MIWEQRADGVGWWMWVLMNDRDGFLCEEGNSISQAISQAHGLGHLLVERLRTYVRPSGAVPVAIANSFRMTPIRPWWTVCCAGLSLPQDTSLVGADPVVWYSFGVTHSPRVEDFPVMPVEVGLGSMCISGRVY